MAIGPHGQLHREEGETELIEWYGRKERRERISCSSQSISTNDETHSIPKTEARSSDARCSSQLSQWAVQEDIISRRKLFSESSVTRTGSMGTERISIQAAKGGTRLKRGLGRATTALLLLVFVELPLVHLLVVVNVLCSASTSARRSQVRLVVLPSVKSLTLGNISIIRQIIVLEEVHLYYLSRYAIESIVDVVGSLVSKSSSLVSLQILFDFNEDSVVGELLGDFFGNDEELHLCE